MRTNFFFIFLAAVLVYAGTLDAQRSRREPTGPRIEPEDLDFEMGVAAIKDREMFEELSYQGDDVMRDSYLAGLEFVKFCIDKKDPENHKVYYMNTQNHRAHPPYMGRVGISTRERGAITYHPQIAAPDGSAGIYVVDFQPNDSYKFEDIQRILDLLTKTSPMFEGKIAFHPLRGNLTQYKRDQAKYEEAKLAVHLDSDLYKNIVYLPLNPAESFGLLRVLNSGDRPSPREIVICKTLPNEMPRVAGVISEVRQTPLSHVNLRAVQDNVPNAFINNALNDEKISSLVGKLVRYEVNSQGYRLREATTEEVNEYFEKIRPTEMQVPIRDLDQKSIVKISNLQFDQSKSFGVKAANLGALHQMKLPAGTMPDGMAVPFYFYDQFMQANGFYDDLERMLADESFRADREVQQQQLAEFRSKIEKGTFPEELMTALSAARKSFGADDSIRCRSSTNNEDLPGFSGAGLYDSFTHTPDEGHLEKSIKQVYASTWNFRAFEEREFYRIDHLKTAMGVVLHRNFKNERANGVAVTDDILYATYGNYYLNTQIGEDMVTNPNAESSPEEILLGWWERDGFELIRKSTDADENGQLMSDDHLAELRDHLAIIHRGFQRHYGKRDNEKFAMEIEYKITNEGKLVIKQARPWVY